MSNLRANLIAVGVATLALMWFPVGALAQCDGGIDCNGNGIDDVCDIADCVADPACDDCNLNGIPDGCDIQVNELLINGGFETGDFTGWAQLNSGSGGIAINDGSLNPAGPDGPLPPCDGSFASVTFQGGPGRHTLYQQVTIPAGAGSATLSWTDRIRNHASVFSDPNQEFRVEIWDTNNNPLLEVFSTNPGDPLLNDCTDRSADLSAFIGQTIRIAFTQEDNLFFFNAHLDNVSLLIPNAGASDDCNLNGIPDECDISVGTSDDCNANGIADECETDCNSNGVADDCDIADGTSADCDSNGIPDDCEADCNGNLIGDACELADCLADPACDDCNVNGELDECDIAACVVGNPACDDCNLNGAPDECDIASGVSDDCNANGIPDDCEADCNANGIADECDIADCTADSACGDCNLNGAPDECDIGSGNSNDCNVNGVPDECETDCNFNGIADECDIADGTSADCNDNGAPDECDIGSQNDLYGSDPAGNNLLIVDANTGLATVVGPFTGAAGRVTEIEWSPDGSVIYATTGGGSRSLHTIDPETGSVQSTVRHIFGALNGLEFDAAGQLLGAFIPSPGQPSVLVIVNTDTGDFTTIGPTGRGNIGGLAFEAGFARLIGITSASSGIPPVLLDVNPNTGAATPIATTNLTVEVSALDFTADGRLIGGGSDGILYEFNLTTGAATPIGPLVNATKLSGLTAVPSGAADCNNNGLLDECDIANGFSSDCDLNGTPDECDPDCNANGIADTCDITDCLTDLACADCNLNGIPDGCDISACNGDTGCDDCNLNGRPDECDIAIGVSDDCNANGIPDDCEADCDGNGVADDCDIAACTADPACGDCNLNNVPDVCDIDSGVSDDCIGNGIPDECEPDCNTNGIADECDIAGGFSDDCDGNSIPDDCEADCNANNIADQCDLADCVADPACGDCNLNDIPDECDIADCVADSACDDCNLNGVPDACDLGETDLLINGGFESGDFTGWTQINTGSGGIAINDGTFVPPGPDGALPPCDGSFASVTFQGGPGRHSLYQQVSIPAGASSVVLSWTDRIRNHASIFSDPNQEFRVEIWDTNNNPLLEVFSTNPGDPLLNDCTSRSANVSAFAGQTVRVAFTQEDNLFFFNVHVDNIRLVLVQDGESDDCNANAIPDECDVASGASDDCNANSIPDECEPDCNGNGIADECDIADCLGNPACGDCNRNNVPDECDIADGTSPDCNTNGLPDECDIADGTSTDCQPNDIPDDCEPDADADTVPDDCDNCVNTPNAEQVDTDGDGEGNACDDDDDNDCLLDDLDESPLNPRICEDVDRDGCDDCAVGTDGFGPLCDNNPNADGSDRDGDGVCDLGDGCPDDPNKIDPGICGCGRLDDGDSDGDGVLDCVDQCRGVDDAVFAPCEADIIPAVSQWGLVILALLLLTAAKIRFGSPAVTRAG